MTFQEIEWRGFQGYEFEFEGLHANLMFTDKTRNKKITDSGNTIRYFWLRRRDLKACPNR